MIDRLYDAIRKIIKSELPDFPGVYEYAIQSVNSDGSVDIDPTDTTIGLPSHKKIKLEESVKPTVGNTCYLVFVNGKSSRPLILSCTPTNEEVDLDATALLKLGKSAPVVQIAGGGQPVARMGDAILAAGIFAGTITTGSTRSSSG